MLRQIALPSLSLETKENSWLKNLLLVIGGSLLITIFARIAIPLPFSPIPIALQGHICLLLGVLLGKHMGALAVLLYLLEGAAGLPVFAFGHAGLSVLLGPRGGYLIGYIVGAWVAGYMVERSGSKNRRQAMLAMVVGNLMIYLCGLSQLSFFVGLERVFLVGMLPFLIGDSLKLCAAHRLFKLLKFNS
jgi:biotin transport system substrate-specific component